MTSVLPLTLASLVDLAPVVEQLRRIADALERAPLAVAARPLPAAAEAALPPDAQATLDALRRWRSDTARKEGLPAYIVAYNATLREVAERRPKTLEELASIRGFGPAKLARYGPAVLALVAS